MFVKIFIIRNVMAMMSTVSQCIDYQGKHMIIQFMLCNGAVESCLQWFDTRVDLIASDTSYIIPWCLEACEMIWHFELVYHEACFSKNTKYVNNMSCCICMVPLAKCSLHVLMILGALKWKPPAIMYCFIPTKHLKYANI